ncbi:MAG: ECF family RNA polymerase sigma factor SbrI [Anaerolineae bacterium]|nr:MAG: ECF family RNA polymerase sigma factor SbrI [Anaerolineae bacterium]
MSELTLFPPSGSFHKLENDALLIDRCLNGEESAIVTVYNQYAGSIYRLCYGILQQREDSEEVLQDTFEYAFRRLENYDDSKASFKTWLYQIAISRCRNKRRRKLLKTISISQILGEQIADTGLLTPAEEIELSERQEAIWQALGCLSPKLRETAILRYYEGFSYREIGLILSIPQKTAESRMRLAHVALRKMLQTEETMNRDYKDRAIG